MGLAGLTVKGDWLLQAVVFAGADANLIFSQQRISSFWKTGACAASVRDDSKTDHTAVRGLASKGTDMTFGRIGLAAAVAMAGAALAAPAFAQKDIGDLSEAQQDELYCVYDAISQSDNYYDVGDTYLDHIDDDDPVASVATLVSEHVEACKTQYRWDKDVTDAATAIGALGTASDVMEEYMLDDGFTAENIDLVFKGMNSLSDEEIDMLISAAWVDDKAIQSSVMAKLAQLGFPKDNNEQKTHETLTLVELNLIVFFISNDWAQRVLK